MTARSDSANQRLALYTSLRTRNRVIAALRVLVPISGVLVLVVFLAKILIANIASSFGIGQVHFSGPTVTADNAVYSGVTASGQIYNVSAASAAVNINNLAIIDLTKPTMILTEPSGAKTTATTDAAQFNTDTQVVTAPGVAQVTDDAGDVVTLTQMTVNFNTQLVSADGPTHVVMKDGTVIDGQKLNYDLVSKQWDFGRATLTMPQTPGGDENDAGGTP